MQAWSPGNGLSPPAQPPPGPDPAAAAAGAASPGFGGMGTGMAGMDSSSPTYAQLAQIFLGDAAVTSPPDLLTAGSVGLGGDASGGAMGGAGGAGAAEAVDVGAPDSSDPRIRLLEQQPGARLQYFARLAGAGRASVSWCQVGVYIAGGRTVLP